MDTERSAVARAASITGSGAAAIDLDDTLVTAREKVAAQRNAVLGRPVRIRGVDCVVLDATTSRVVLGVEDGTGADEIERRFPAGELIYVGGYFFRVLSATEARITLIPHGKSKNGKATHK